MALTVLPTFFAFMVVVIWVITALTHVDRYQQTLQALYPSVLPGSSSPVGPIPVAAVLLTTLTVLLMARRRTAQRWAQGDTGAVVLRLTCFTLSVPIALIAFLTPGLVLGAAATVDGPPPMVDPTYTVREGTVMLTAIVALWWSLGATGRCVRKAARQRYEG